MYAAILKEGALIGNAMSERRTAHQFDWRTRAEHAPEGGWTVTSTKYYATGALGARWITVLALGPHDGRVFAFVPACADGLTLDLDVWASFGQRATFSGTVILDHVHLDERWVADTGAPPETPSRSGVPTFDQAMHAAIDVGIARAALEDGAEFTRTRTRPWIEAGVENASQEPRVMRGYGELTTQYKPSANGRAGRVCLQRR